LVQQGNLLMYL